MSVCSVEIDGHWAYCHMLVVKLEEHKNGVIVLITG